MIIDPSDMIPSFLLIGSSETIVGNRGETFTVKIFMLNRIGNPGIEQFADNED
jgi:hypothetical protein